ncbi:hypothetical protein CcaverHIS002_0110330 [Cutaneotrichosporon cavernicola]|nr:hypothetical protein CcaverHIS002_0110330 [Cutaneotrichosporon cavernicola]
MDFSFDAVASMRSPDGAVPELRAGKRERCADESVPYLAEMKRACFTHIEAYRTCLDTHGSKPDDVIEAECGDKLKKLWECTDKTKNEIDARKETK